MKKIVILDGYTLNPGDLSYSGFEALGKVAVWDRTKENQILERIGEAEIVITNKTPITRATLEAAPTIQYIGVLATGYNVVDIEAAIERGVVVTNIPTYGTMAVAQYTFALLLEIAHRVQWHSDAVFAGKWTKSADFSFWVSPLMELADKTIGIIGYGRIGQAVGRIAEAFGMRVFAYDPAAKDDNPALVSLEKLYTESDIISLHCPLFAETEGMINAQSIEMMKDGVIILNTSRGPLIVETDLADALNSGKVGYAAVDVVSEEPIRSDNPLLGAKNILITPHIAWAPRESRARLMGIAVENLRAFLKGEPVNTVS